MMTQWCASLSYTLNLGTYITLELMDVCKLISTNSDRSVRVFKNRYFDINIEAFGETLVSSIPTFLNSKRNTRVITFIWLSDDRIYQVDVSPTKCPTTSFVIYTIVQSAKRQYYTARKIVCYYKMTKPTSAQCQTDKEEVCQDNFSQIAIQWRIYSYLETQNICLSN